MTETKTTFDRKGTTSDSDAPLNKFDLNYFVLSIWSGRWTILLVASLIILVTGFYAFQQKDIYKAEVLLAPSSKSSVSNLSSISSSLGGLASLAGIQFSGGGKSDQTALAIEVIKSRKFLTAFIKRHQLLVPLMASSEWASNGAGLQIDNEIYDEKDGVWKRNVKPGKSPEPSDLEAYKAFSRILNISRSKKTGLVLLSIEFLSPNLAKEWVDSLVTDINFFMKQRDVDEAKASIEFLKRQLSNTEISEMQNVFYQLIEEQTKTLMLSAARDEYVFLTIDPAVVPEEKIGPRRLHLIILGAVFGVLIGTLLQLILVLSKR